MANLEASRVHPLCGEFQRKLRDAFFIVDEDDRAEVLPILLKKSYKDFDSAVLDIPDWIWQRVRRSVPPPKELYERVRKVLDYFRDIVDSKGRPLYTATLVKNEPEVLELI